MKSLLIVLGVALVLLAGSASGQECPPGEVVCVGSDECIKEEYVCDGYWSDCANGWDEIDCPCAEFQCDDGDCIPNRWVCDGEPDCLGGEDEANCTCDGFKCDDGLCIPEYWLCDGYDDCNGGEDERGCPCDGFVCDNGDCIPEDYLCDDDNDCSGGEDERNCTCAPDKVSCPDSNKCIPEYWFCDYVVDCPDGSDEANCNRTMAARPSSMTIKLLTKEHGHKPAASQKMAKQIAKKMNKQKHFKKQCTHFGRPQSKRPTKLNRNRVEKHTRHE